MKTVEIHTRQREQLVPITSEVAAALRESGLSNGACVVYVPHTTAGVTINENADPDVAGDIIAGLARLIPRSWPFRHAEGNSDAHLKASLIGSSVVVPVRENRLQLGTWQGIYFAEFDGPRCRQCYIEFVEEIGGET